MRKNIQKIKKVVSKFGLLSIFIALNIKGNAQTTTVVYSGALSTYTVPAGVGVIKIEALGSGGAAGTSGGTGGLGARMIGTFTVIPGNVLNVYAGGNPGLQAGGQGSYVSLGATPLIVAGGGGGGGYSAAGVNAPTTTSGLGPIITSYGGGVGGTAGSGGTAGPGAWGIGGGGGWLSAGANGIGSVGGAILCKASLGTTFAGGSGGGYSGGGGAAMDSGWGTVGGGAGGSYNVGTNQSNTAGYQTGNGSVIITVLSGLSITQTSTIACNGLLTAALSASVTGVSGPFTYSWSPSGGTASTATGLGAGTYTCVATPSVGSAISNTFVITQPAVLVSTVSSKTNVTCYGGANGVITLTTTGGIAPYSYTWSPTGGSAATATGLSANTYSCIVKDANLCSATSPSATITQPATFSVATSNSIICVGGTATLTATGATSYTWNTAATTSVIAVSPTVTTTYTITGVTGICTNSLTITQNVNTCTGINEILANSISVYPNPNNGILNINLTSELAVNSTLEVYDALGKLVVKQVLANELNTINISNLNNGIYTYKVLNNSNNVKIGKLIKQ
jgi:hypothetical protein